jgi:hypothetical protein
LSGVMLGVKEKVGGDKVENQELGAELLHMRVLDGKTPFEVLFGMCYR